MRPSILAVFALCLAPIACMNGVATSPSTDDPPVAAPVDPSAPVTPASTTCASPRSTPSFRCVAAATAPRFGLALCGNLEADNTLSIEQRNNRDLPLAVSGSTRSSAPLHVAGDFVSFGAVEARNTQDIDGNFSTAGDWITSSPVHVHGDAFVGGMLHATNRVDIDGTLHGNTDGNGSVSMGASAPGAPVVAMPVDCSRAPNLEAIAATLDVAAVRDLEAITEPTELTLGCGAYRFTAVTANNTLTLHIAAPTTVVVDGDWRVAAPTRIELAPGATLDLIVRGSLSVDNTLTIGDSARPGAVWMGVGGGVRVASPLTLAGTLVAPRAALEGDNRVEITGSALLGGLRVAAPMVLLDGPSVTANGCVASAL